MQTLYIDVSHTIASGLNTGLQRVVKSTLGHAVKACAAKAVAVEAVAYSKGLGWQQFTTSEALQLILKAEHAPVRNADRINLRSVDRIKGAYRRALQCLAALAPTADIRAFILAPRTQFGLTWLLAAPSAVMRRAIKSRRNGRDKRPELSLPNANSAIVLIDASWYIPHFMEAVKIEKSRGVRIIGVVYDLIPITHPEVCGANNIPVIFEAWITDLVEIADVIICISQFTAQCIDDFIANRIVKGLKTNRPIVDYYHLGSELSFRDGPAGGTPFFKAMFDRSGPILIMVGSIDPRKNHGFVLSAFERLWEQGHDATLIVIGKYGWDTGDFLSRAYGHPQFNAKLFIVRDASDEDLDYAYSHASALVVASIVEGFGLPIVEAFQRDLPVICSDIPVFREIADGKATFFKLSSPEHLAAAITALSVAHTRGASPTAPTYAWYTWAESTRMLVDKAIHHLATVDDAAASASLLIRSGGKASGEGPRR